MPNPVPGTIVPTGALVSPGGNQGAGGPMGPNGPTVVSADAGNIATLGSDNLISVPRSVITGIRLRSFNAIQNPNFEVDQRNAGTQGNLAAGNTARWMDRWYCGKNAATGVVNYGQGNPSVLPVVPGTNFTISQNCASISVVTPQATLAAGEYTQLLQYIEGPLLRELISDTHSFSILAICSQPITFTVALLAVASPFYTLTKLCTISTPNQWTLFTLPNLPVWTPSATWSLLPGNAGYLLIIGLGAGSTFTSPANDTWQSGNFKCGPGTTNFLSLPANTAFNVGFVQHEPGPYCTTLIDKPFTQNLSECQRHYCKSYSYGTAAGSTGAPASTGLLQIYTNPSAQPYGPIRFKQTLAKTPTGLNFYSQVTGAAGVVRDGTAAVDRAVTGGASAGDDGFVCPVIGSAPTTAWIAQYHYTADTGW